MVPCLNIDWFEFQDGGDFNEFLTTGRNHNYLCPESGYIDYVGTEGTSLFITPVNDYTDPEWWPQYENIYLQFN